jgi:hypothetical protein
MALIRQISTTGFQQVAKIYMDSLKNLLLYLVYSQIWLDEHNFGLHPKMGLKKKKKKLATESEVRTFLEKTLQLSQGGSVSFSGDISPFFDKEIGKKMFLKRKFDYRYIILKKIKILGLNFAKFWISNF